MKDFIYLVQGQASLVHKFKELIERPNADVILLTYDEPLEGAVFFPESTWAEGRNKLLEDAARKGDYLYYIFCDDDTLFEKGSWKTFEDMLLKYLPGVGIPIFPKTRNSALRWPPLKCQPFFVNDEQLMAFHRDVVRDGLVLPYQTRFDKDNWWASCEIQQLLIQTFYPHWAVQFNEIVVENTCEKRYSTQFQHHSSFRSVVREWLDKEFTESYSLTSHYIPLRLHRLLLRTLKFTCKSKFTARRSVDLSIPMKMLSSESVLLRNFMERHHLH